MGRSSIPAKGKRKAEARDKALIAPFEWSSLRRALDAAKNFRTQAVAKVESEIYQCYAKASETKIPSGLTLAESAPTKTDEVTKLLGDYWDKNCWTKANQDAWAEKVAKAAKLKKAPPGK